MGAGAIRKKRIASANCFWADDGALRLALAGQRHKSKYAMHSPAGVPVSQA